MKTRILIATAAVAISGAFATGASAAAKADTEVTIKGPNGDYYGYVKSSDSDCESDRKVNVYKMLGSSPDRGQDQKIGSDIAQPNGPDGMWSIGNSGYKKGKFYAHASEDERVQGRHEPGHQPVARETQHQDREGRPERAGPLRVLGLDHRVTGGRHMAAVCAAASADHVQGGQLLA